MRLGFNHDCADTMIILLTKCKLKIKSRRTSKKPPHTHQQKEGNHQQADLRISGFTVSSYGRPLVHNSIEFFGLVTSSAIILLLSVLVVVVHFCAEMHCSHYSHSQ